MSTQGPNIEWKVVHRDSSITPPGLGTWAWHRAHGQQFSPCPPGIDAERERAFHGRPYLLSHRSGLPPPAAAPGLTCHLRFASDRYIIKVRCIMRIVWNGPDLWLPMRRAVMTTPSNDAATEGKAEARRSLCPVSCALDVVGDRWTLLVIRDLLGGKRRYGDFLASAEKIPTNILADRSEAAGARGSDRARPLQHTAPPGRVSPHPGRPRTRARRRCLGDVGAQALSRHSTEHLAQPASRRAAF